jgi:HD-GYP domain-containing protein (c-di-GMP phosphodiesterase class II)
MRTGEISVCNDIATDPAFAEWRRLALERGFAATTAFPLHDSEQRPIGMLAIYSDTANVFSAEEVGILTELAGDLSFGINALRAGAARDSAEANAREWQRQLAGTLERTVQALAGMVELRDPYTAGHQRRAAELAVAIGREMGLDERRLEGLLVIGMMHDVGKIQVPQEILSRPCKLTDLEFNLIKSHPESGYQILKDVPFPWPVADTVRQHHERLDGSGYPQGLRGEQVLLEARIIAVADVVEAMASYRPYREAIPLDEVMAEIERQAGILFDPDVVTACLRLFREQGFIWGQPTIVEKKRESGQTSRVYH